MTDQPDKKVRYDAPSGAASGDCCGRFEDCECVNERPAVVHELRQAMHCLRLEVPDAVWQDVNAKVERVLTEIEGLQGALANIGREDRLLSPSTLRMLAREAIGNG